MDREAALDKALDALATLPQPIGGRPELGAIVWERQPAEADYQRRGGMVVDPPAEDGTVLCLQLGKRRGETVLHPTRLAIRDLDPAMAEPSSRAKMGTYATAICAALGATRGRWDEERRRWLERARDLAEAATL